jgi:prophage regulatory protein
MEKNPLPLKVLNLKQLAVTLGLSQAQIKRMVSEGTFPPPVQLSERRKGWLNTEVDLWLKGKK